MNAPSFPALGKYVDLLVDAICVVDKQGHFLYVSPSAEQIFGYSQMEMMGRQMLDLMHPDDRQRTLHTVAGIMAGEPQPHFENRYIRKDGEIVHIMWSARWSEADQCRVAVARDITRRKHAESIQQAVFAIAEASHNTQDLNTLFAQIHRIISELLPADNFAIALRDKSSAAVSLPYSREQVVMDFGNDSSETSNQLLNKVLHKNEACLYNAMHERMALQSWLGVPLKSHSGVLGALVLKSYSAQQHYSEKNLELLQFVSTQIAAAVERKQMMARLEHLALYDQLTKLPNRTLFYDRIHSAMARAKRHQVIFSLLYLDMDKFKAVNDNYGHTAGDVLLEQAARRLESCVRECDTVVRFGGDEFVILLENLDYPEQSITVVQKIRDVFQEAFDLQGQMVRIMPSIGIAHYPLDGDTDQALLRHADNAMYAAKQNAVNVH
ncbi:sensor domain-containing diguanylate cyclase [Cellvibrio sp. pealriver]|uniref:sensor domain-containing protein n=1 Tax=Cellvibrio sp. pealriver TaxID=1622269 RepID=UPI00066FD168|nr:sensor domain-containing diguanylate cyclase [Cellvibrio sp. pealriver]